MINQQSLARTENISTRLAFGSRGIFCHRKPHAETIDGVEELLVFISPYAAGCHNKEPNSQNAVVVTLLWLIGSLQCFLILPQVNIDGGDTKDSIRYKFSLMENHKVQVE